MKPGPESFFIQNPTFPRFGNSNTFSIRASNSTDIAYIRNLYRSCENKKNGHGPFVESRFQHFDHAAAIVPMDLGSSGFDTLHYFTIQDSQESKIGVITNLRSSAEKHERIGMLLDPNLRSQGIGTAALIKIIADRKLFADRISGVVAEGNTACCIASERAGGERIESVKTAIGEELINIVLFDFFRRER